MSSTLLLLPTALERTQFEQHSARSEFAQDGKPPVSHLCGFGPIIAAARTAELLATHRPKRVCLIGIAGSLQPDLVVGQAYFFSLIQCYGLGVGTGSDFQSASQLGWPQWPEEPQIEDQILAETPASSPSPGASPRDELCLLTTPAASANPEEAAIKTRQFPQAAAEDMEAFAVAAACRLAGVPLTVIRGISNSAGHRDHSQWKIEAAMQSATLLFHQTNQSEWTTQTGQPN